MQGHHKTCIGLTSQTSLQERAEERQRKPLIDNQEELTGAATGMMIFTIEIAEKKEV